MTVTETRKAVQGAYCPHNSHLDDANSNANDDDDTNHDANGGVETSAAQ
jgi:hypothetical protein